MNDTDKKEITFVEAPVDSYEIVPLEKIHGVPAPRDKSRQKSLSELGMIKPVSLCPAPDGMFYIVDGRRRIINAQAVGFGAVPALIKELTRTEYLIHSLVLNMGRSPSPMVEAELMAELYQTHTQQEIAQMLSITQALVSQRLGLLDLVEELRVKLKLEEMTLTAARAAKKLPPDAQRELAKLDKVTVTAAQDMLRQYQSVAVDLTTINIPEMPRPDQTDQVAEPPKPITEIVLSANDFQKLRAGQEIEVNGIIIRVV